jgi:hypothetical protein
MDKQIISKIANEIISTKVLSVAELIEHQFSKIAMTTGELVFRTSQRSI